MRKPKPAVSDEAPVVVVHPEAPGAPDISEKGRGCRKSKRARRADTESACNSDESSAVSPPVLHVLVFGFWIFWPIFLACLA